MLNESNMKHKWWNTFSVSDFWVSGTEKNADFGVHGFYLKKKKLQNIFSVMKVHIFNCLTSSLWLNVLKINVLFKKSYKGVAGF